MDALQQPASLHVNDDACSQCRSTNGFDVDFTMAFQPIVETATGAVFAHEALVREPGGNSAAPIFAHVNETNLYHFDQACRTRAIELAASVGIEEMLSINFMPNAVYTPERCLRTTLRVAQETGFPLDRIIFEIVETEEVVDLGHLQNIAETYRAYGMKMALDDVGSGHSGLNRLVDLHADVLKLDRHLVHGIDRDPRRQAVVSSVLRLADDLGSRVVAEGIETRPELLTAVALGVELVQGFFIARPQLEGAAAISNEAWEVLRSRDLQRRGGAAKP